MNHSIAILKSCLMKQGGAEKYARCLADAFFKRGCSVTMLTTGAAAPSVPYSVMSHTLKSRTSVGKVWEFEQFCSNWLKEHPHEVVLGLDRNYFQTHLRAGSGVHRSYLEHRRGFEPFWKGWRHKLNPLHTTLLQIEKKSFEHPALRRLFVNSHLVAQEVVSHYEVDPQKICVIHNGVQWQEWQKPFDEAEGYRDPSRFQFLFLGHDFERKGLRPLLYGLKALHNRDVHLSVVGNDRNEPRFQRLVDQLNLRTQVSFFSGGVSPLPFLQKSDALAIPSHYDPFANATVEALAMGLFVVSSKTNGGSEVLTEETGTLIRQLSDPLSVASALEKALDRPKTVESATKIRSQIKHLDFSIQLSSYLDQCLSPIF